MSFNAKQSVIPCEARQCAARLNAAWRKIRLHRTRLGASKRLRAIIKIVQIWR